DSPAASEAGTRLVRQPTVSETHIAFVHANDLWIVGREGGDAIRLTSHEGGESAPHFSPDGRLIAFSGQYGGNTDVYVVPAEGGEPRRLTWHPGADVVQGWTPDGSAVVFRSGREGHPTQRAKFFRVPLDGGLPEALAIPQAWSGELSRDGRSIAYQEFGFFDPEWRNYRGGQARPIRIVSLDDHRTLGETPWEGARHMDPVWLDGEVFFLSERDWASNIWSYDPAADELRQRTFHADFDVKSLDAGGGAIVYEQGGWLHLLDPATDETRRVEVRVRGDLNHSRTRWVDVEPQRIVSAALSPTGRRAVFEARGEIFTVPAEHGDWRNLSKSPGAADRFPAWSPDGEQIAWFSDAGGEYRLVIRDQRGFDEPREIELPNPTFYFRPAWSPDGRFIAYTDTDMNLWYVDIETGGATRVDTERHAYPVRSMQPVWSPDSRWIAYARRLDNHLRAIFVHDVESDETHRITDAMSDALAPAWDASGKHLYFLASTDFALNTGWLDMTSYDRPVTRGVYVAVLSADEPSPLLPRSDEEGPGAGAGAGGEEASAEGRGDPGGDGGSGEGEEVVVRIDFEGLDQRILALDVPERDYTQILAGPAGTIFYAERPAGASGGPFGDGGGQTLHRYTFEEREARPFLEGVADAVVSHDRQKLLYGAGPRWGIVGTTGGPAEVGDGELALDELRMRLDPRAEWRQIFREGWRFQRDFLYVDNMHGAPWDEIYDWYRPWVEHVRHRSDLNYVLDIMGGEVSIGHSYTGGGDIPDPDGVSVGLLGADLEPSEGRYRIARIYDGESWNPNLRAPLRGPGIDIAEGDYILAVNGVELRASDNPYRLLEGTADRQTTLLVSDRPDRDDGAREIVVVPTGGESQLRTRAWVEANRRRVDEMSGGRLAYVWLPNTST
ncbi:MAG: S41 family peptidase, partial [Gemmatimonadota bacterium]